VTKHEERGWTERNPATRKKDDSEAYFLYRQSRAYTIDYGVYDRSIQRAVTPKFEENFIVINFDFLFPPLLPPITTYRLYNNAKCDPYLSWQCGTFPDGRSGITRHGKEERIGERVRNRFVWNSGISYWGGT
jgi:hypothetical protein